MVLNSKATVRDTMESTSSASLLSCYTVSQCSPLLSVSYVSSNNEVKWSEVLVAQLYPTLCNPMDCYLLGPSVHGILQARILEWVAILSSRGSSQPMGWTQDSCIAGRFSNLDLLPYRQIHNILWIFPGMLFNESILNYKSRAFLMVQLLRIHLPKQGT